MDIPNEFGVDGIEDAFEALCKCKKAFDQYLKWMVEQSINSIYEIFGGQRKLDLYHLLKEWYEKQSSLSKQGLHSGGITNLMSCIEKMDAYGDDDVAQKVIKAVTNVYIENWLDDAFDGFVLELTRLKNDIENIKEENSDGKYLLSFVGGKGNTIEKYYEKANEGTGTVLRNVIEDALDEYDDLSVNDRVAILLEMIERIIG